MLFANTFFQRIRGFNLSLFVTTAFIGMSTAASAAATPLLAYWEFDQPNPRGNTVDTIAGRLGVLLGGAAFTADAGGQTGLPGDYAIDFLPPGGETDIDNKREQILVSNATFLNTGSNSVTYSVWVQTAPNAHKFSQVFQAKNQSGFWGVAAGVSGVPAIRDISFTVADESDTVRVEPHDFGQWSHLAYVKDGDTRQIWLDGTEVLEQDRPELLPTDFTLLSIGSFPEGNFSFQGKLDDFAIFDGPLTAEQIGRLAAGESALTVAVPEPASVALSLLAAVGAVGFRGQSRRSAKRLAHLSANDLHSS